MMKYGMKGYGSIVLLGIRLLISFQIMESNGSHTVSAPSISQMSKFALVAQAARLLGQVLEHISNPVNNPEDTVQQDIQLDRTVRSLVYASQRASVPACDAVAICYR